MIRNTPAKERIVAFAPEGANLKVVGDVLTNAGFACCACNTVEKFCTLLHEGVGAAIILNEYLTPENTARIRQVLQSQPPWSDFAIILFVTPSSMQIPYLEMFGSHRNIITLELPLRTFALVGLLRSLLQARRRQYENRDFIYELERTKEELLTFKTDLESKNKELEAIIGIVSHDLRAPLLNVRGFNKFIKDDCGKIQKLLSSIALPPGVQKQLDAIVVKSMAQATGFIDASAVAMNNLIESLIRVARAGLVVPNPETLDMNQLINSAVASIKVKLKDAGAILDVAELPPCFADKMHTTQIFTNLIDNAVKYLDRTRQGEICVSGRIENGCAVYWVADNGIGIAAEHQEKVFDAYYRIIEKAGVGGEGVGLSVVKRMVERNKGRMWLVSDNGNGCNFFVALPITPPHYRLDTSTISSGLISVLLTKN